MNQESHIKLKGPRNPKKRIPEGRYLFQVLYAAQVDAGDLGELILMTMRIERGIYEGRCFRFFKPALNRNNPLDETHTVRPLIDPKDDINAEVIFSFGDWHGINFYATVVHVTREDGSVDSRIRDVNRVGLIN